MVKLSDVQASNALISSTLPASLVGVFVGATSGIGEATLKEFARQARTPRAYFVGRSQDAGDRIVAECRKLNAAGEYIFIKADVSLIRVVDEVCEVIKAKEQAINILFLSAGVPSMDRSQTSEHLHLLAALTYYSRTRFMINLLPQIKRAPALRRVVTVGGAGLEGPLDTADFPALHVPLVSMRGHLITLLSFGLESVAQTAPEVSFVHDYPGAVNTQLFHRMKGIMYLPSLIMRLHFFLLGWLVCVPIKECGERHLYLATSAKFPDASGSGCGVAVKDGIAVAQGTTGSIGSGVYSVQMNCESGSPAVEKLLAGYRDKGTVKALREHTENEFKRITEQNKVL